MTDIEDKEKRSRMMAGIKGKESKPELMIRKALFARGFRYKLHDKSLPGKPDMVFPKYRAVIQVNGCFWHRHDCHIFKWPKSRTEFWKAKITGNVERDRRNINLLEEQGWQVLTIWECSLKGKTKEPLDKLIDRIEAWIVSHDVPTLDIHCPVNGRIVRLWTDQQIVGDFVQVGFHKNVPDIL